MDQSTQGIIGFFLVMGILVSLLYIFKLAPGLRQDYREWRRSRETDDNRSTRRNRMAWRERPDPLQMV